MNLIFDTAYDALYYSKMKAQCNAYNHKIREVKIKIAVLLEDIGIK